MHWSSLKGTTKLSSADAPASETSIFPVVSLIDHEPLVIIGFFAHNAPLSRSGPTASFMVSVWLGILNRSRRFPSKLSNGVQMSSHCSFESGLLGFLSELSHPAMRSEHPIAAMNGIADDRIASYVRFLTVTKGRKAER